jgi:cytochrome c biogenesis protein CcdA
MAQIISYFANDTLFAYGDLISAGVILIMGIYLVYLAFSNNIRIDSHSHKNEKHTHIYYKNAHLHDKGILVSLGLLMGVGGIRGMLITLSAVSSQSIGVEMILAFVLGVSVVFICFGYLIYLINEQVATSMNSLRYAVMSVGLFSIIVGSYNLSGVFNVT